jgi:hypothetical protein
MPGLFLRTIGFMILEREEEGFLVKSVILLIYFNI